MVGGPGRYAPQMHVVKVKWIKSRRLIDFVLNMPLEKIEEWVTSRHLDTMNGTTMIIKTIVNQIKERSYWYRHQWRLNSMNRMEQFLSHVQKTQPSIFLRYRNASSQKRIEFQTVVDELCLKLNGIKFLDIGPAYGDSLDICHEKGAEVVDFVEWDPFFFTYNRLKGFAKGYKLNHLLRLNRLQPGKYDLIWVKGSFGADVFVKMSLILSLSRWLVQIERLASPSCKIVICPYWSHDTYTRNIEDVQHNSFTETMLTRGYVILPRIANHNTDLEYPITFYKDMSPSNLVL
jgi:hypothetical protein